jgi:hypothetical protein
MKTNVLPLILLSIAFSSHAYAAGVLDSLPDVPDKAPECMLGRYVFPNYAIKLAKDLGLPAPKTYSEALDVIAQFVLTKCEDDQLLTMGDQAGDAEADTRGRKLLQKLCDESGIVVEKMQYVDLAQWPKARVWKCKLSKIKAIRKALAEPKRESQS